MMSVNQHDLKFDTWNVGAILLKVQGVQIDPYAFIPAVIDQTPHRHQAIIYSIFLTISQNPDGCMGVLGVVSEDRNGWKFDPKTEYHMFCPELRQNKLGAGKTEYGPNGCWEDKNSL